VSLYKEWIVNANKKNASSLASEQSKLDLMTAERDWLINVDSTNIRSDVHDLKGVNDTLITFARDLKLKKDGFGISIAKMVVAGEANNSIVEISNRIIVINGIQYIPIDIFGGYTLLNDVQQFINWMIANGYLLRSIKMTENFGFELSTFIPTSGAKS
jgi:hypothetical protein